MNSQLPLSLFYCSLIILFGCTTSESELITTDAPLNTIPEGIAILPESGDIVLSSLHLDKILRCNKRGNNCHDLIPSGARGYTTGVGMETHNNMLYALGSINREKRSILLFIDLKSEDIVNSFQLPDTVPNFFNDLAIDDYGNAYISDTEQHKVYKLDIQKKRIESFMTHEEIQYPNGIALSDDGTKLFVDSYMHGIRIVNIDTKQILNPQHEPSTKIGIDGLKYWDNALYAVINGPKDKSQHGVMRYGLSDDHSDIIAADWIINEDDKLDVPTTLDIAEGTIYLLANSQLDNLDQDKNEIIDTEILTPTYIIRKLL